MLVSNIKGVTNGYPLKIEADQVETRESEFDAEFITSMLPKIEYGVLVEAAAALGFTDLPPAHDLTEELKADESFLAKVHHALLDLHLVDGRLVCPETNRPFQVKDGIPNMLLHEDEV
eukprot:CAMPEP_0172594722 /NCGR_PEP_ID=MMETSP1068-20121228/14187_1 /TAXON_ID=35684 /ORGANISM="Pseudopedinella elastica, Strain CCMP716" /LENGTH=117 /DNA_ID=CAMNT_0013392903 /DNA_START=57 /DNA_END=410 /DNA_ORIENTATION=-